MISLASLITILGVADLLYAAPLVLVVSLVYAATRQELMKPILQHAGRLTVMIAGFMLVVFCVLWLLSSVV